MDCSGKEKTRHFVRLVGAWWREHGRIWLGLCLLTLLLWQFRFERCGPNLIPDHACESLEHWSEGKSVTPEQVRAGSDGLVIIKRRNQPNFSLSRPLEGLEKVGYLAVTCDASWEHTVPHPAARWLSLRLVIAGYDANNRFSAPLDHGVIYAHGSKGWHRVQAVMQLPVELKKVVISIDGFGEEGVMRLRGLTVEPVRQRVWFVPATALLLAAWTWAFSRLLITKIRGRWVQARAFVIACGILAGAWFFVFPQGRTMFPSLIGGFVMGPEFATVQKVSAVPMEEKVEEAPVQPRVQPPPKPVPTPAPDAPRPRLRVIPPSTPTWETSEVPTVPEIVKVKPVPLPVTVAPQERKEFSLGLWLRELDRKWNWKKYNLTHFTAFFGIGLFVFGCAGSARIWPLPFGIALLGEIIPNLIYNTWDKGDWWDVASNVGGLVLALGIVLLFQRIRRWVWKRFGAHKMASREDAGPDELEIL